MSRLQNSGECTAACFLRDDNQQLKWLLYRTICEKVQQKLSLKEKTEKSDTPVCLLLTWYSKCAAAAEPEALKSKQPKVY